MKKKYLILLGIIVWFIPTPSANAETEIIATSSEVESGLRVYRTIKHMNTYSPELNESNRMLEMNGSFESNSIQPLDYQSSREDVRYKKKKKMNGWTIALIITSGVLLGVSAFISA